MIKNRFSISLALSLSGNSPIRSGYLSIIAQDLRLTCIFLSVLRVARQQIFTSHICPRAHVKFTFLNRVQHCARGRSLKAQHFGKNTVSREKSAEE